MHGTGAGHLEQMPVHGRMLIFLAGIKDLYPVKFESLGRTGSANHNAGAKATAQLGEKEINPNLV
ncbi:MAG: hypothetical protein IBX57_02885 [Gammaproteobacteria bacterium]|nr:hypothetical protein [Gammaproteobacteria bacterium]